VPRDASLWQYGFYGHPDNQAIWGNASGQAGASPWVPWVGATQYTARGGAAGSRLNPWDGDELYIQFKIKVDPQYWNGHTLPFYDSVYWIRKFFALQSEISVQHQLVVDLAISNVYNLPNTKPNPIHVNTYKDTQVIGTADWTGTPYTRTHPSRQMGSPWDVSPYYAYCNPPYPTGSFGNMPSTGVAGTPDGSAMMEWPSDEWITFQMRVKPGHSNLRDTLLEVKFARSFHPSYTGQYTTLVSVNDARVVYGGRGDYDYPDGYFTSGQVPNMDVLPGYQAFYLFGYYNIHSMGANSPPPMRSYWTRVAQVIFSRQPIPPPAQNA
jgi:hypothetical protein